MLNLVKFTRNKSSSGKPIKAILKDVEKILNPLEFGNKDQLELLSVLDFMQYAQENFVERQEFYIN